MSEKNKQLTAIIPVKNLSGGIKRLEDTIRTALHFKVNVIVVHDREKECVSSEMLALLALLDSFKAAEFRYVTEDVGAPGLARNLGLQTPSSGYTAFWDADDAPQISDILKTLKNDTNNWDILIGQYTKIDSLSGLKIGEDSNHLDLEQVALNPGLWRMVFRNDFIKGVRFNSAVMGEDQDFFAQCLAKNPNLEISKSIFYNYYVNVQGQLTGNPKAVQSLEREILKTVRFQKNATEQCLHAQMIMQFRKIITISRLNSLRALNLAIHYIACTISINGLGALIKLLRAFIITIRYVGFNK